MTDTTSALPRWSWEQYFPGMESEEFVTEFNALREDAANLAGEVAALTEDASADSVKVYEAVTSQQIDLIKRLMVAMSYLSCTTAVNSRDTLAARRLSELQLAMIPIFQANTQFTAWLGQQDVGALIEQSDLAKEHAFIVRSAKVEAEHLMSQPEEFLASELMLSGGSAWGKLHSDIDSQILVTFDKREGETVTLPMSEVRNLAMDPDRDVRRRAFEAELGAWKQWATPMAAALNGVKGEHTTLARKRGWDSILDQSLFQNHIDRETLDAMMDAARDAFPDIRRYWAAKSKALGVDKLMWYDVTAPVGEDNREWSWNEAVMFVRDQFYAFSDRMGSLIDMSVDEQWIDVPPREGKTGGAFCSGTRDGKSAVMLNFTPSFDSVSTLAHELGHAYHNLAAKDSSPLWGINTPMTLAETASTFCETILRKAAIEQGSEDEQFGILEGALVDAGQIVVDITSRFLFEQSVVERRASGELSIDDFNELMIDAQKQTYGDAIAEDGLHPYMWAVKSHYYGSGFAFYNYPYMFGLLFGLGLYAKYVEDPEAFKANYDELLAATGSADAATLAARFDIDIRSKAFWTASLDVIRQDVDAFVQLVDKRYS